MSRKEDVPNRRYTLEYKIEAVRLAESIGGSQAAKRLEIPDSSLWNWIRLSRAGKLQAGNPAGTPARRAPTGAGSGERSAAARVGGHKAGRRSIKKSCGVLREGIAVRYAWVDAHRGQFAITRMCRLLQVSRTGYCQWRGRGPSPRSLANTALDVQVAAIHAQSRCSYGRERIVRQLRTGGLTPGHERVRKSLLRQKLRPVYRRPYRVTTDSKHDKPIAANRLNRRFEGWRMNRAWVGDITYIATAEGWLYLAK